MMQPLDLSAKSKAPPKAKARTSTAVPRSKARTSSTAVPRSKARTSSTAVPKSKKKTEVKKDVVKPRDPTTLGSKRSLPGPAKVSDHPPVVASCTSAAQAQPAPKFYRTATHSAGSASQSVGNVTLNVTPQHGNSALTRQLQHGRFSGVPWLPVARDPVGTAVSSPTRVSVLLPQDRNFTFTWANALAEDVFRSAPNIVAVDFNPYSTFGPVTATRPSALAVPGKQVCDICTLQDQLNKQIHEQKTQQEQQHRLEKQLQEQNQQQEQQQQQQQQRTQRTQQQEQQEQKKKKKEKKLLKKLLIDLQLEQEVQFRGVFACIKLQKILGSYSNRTVDPVITITNPYDVSTTDPVATSSADINPYPLYIPSRLMAQPSAESNPVSLNVPMNPTVVPSNMIHQGPIIVPEKPTAPTLAEFNPFPICVPTDSVTGTSAETKPGPCYLPVRRTAPIPKVDTNPGPLYVPDEPTASPAGASSAAPTPTEVHLCPKNPPANDIENRNTIVDKGHVVDNGPDEGGSNRLPSESITTVAAYDQATLASVLGYDEDLSEEEEIAAIYTTDEFKAFRQYYLDCLGPPKNFYQMKRSVPRKLAAGQQVDESYLLKRLKNNAAAKRSRDNKRQKYVENQISVMYLEYKVDELLRIKTTLLGINASE